MINFILIFLILNILFLLLLFKQYRLIDIYDHPDTKLKKHENSMPVFGGILFYGNFIIFYLIDIMYFDYFFNNLNRFSLIFLVSSTGIFIMGLLDDKYNFTPIKKVFMILMFSTILIFSNPNLLITTLDLDLLNTIELNNYSFLFTIMCVFIFINAYNMLDGVDLNICFYNFFLLIFFFYKSNYNFIFLTFIIANSFFLAMNFFKRSYFGNNGAYFFSFIISILSILYFNSSENVNEEDLVLVMLFPVIELIRLFISRIAINKSPFAGDNNHFHHISVKYFGRVWGIVPCQILIALPLLCDYFFKLNMWFNILIFSVFYFSSFYYFKFLLLNKSE
jgi:UDP-GlcNAc:undecaprenyl-phosphate GlcNAc-1-phosphate transferase